MKCHIGPTCLHLQFPSSLHWGGRITPHCAIEPQDISKAFFTRDSPGCSWDVHVRGWAEDLTNCIPSIEREGKGRIASNVCISPCDFRLDEYPSREETSKFLVSHVKPALQLPSMIVLSPNAVDH